MSRALGRTVVDALADAGADALCLVPAWVLRLALVLAAAAITCGGPLWLAVSLLDSLGGLK